MKKKDDFYDDGRTIADMDVEGMPFQGRKLTPHKKNTDSADTPQLSPKEQRQLVVSGMLAGVLIASVFIIAAAVLILILVTFG
ncbi:MAG: hypothetical protein ACI4VI_04720 [Acutalibacteraceae bacterium]